MRRRFPLKPSQFVLVLGVLIAAGTIASGIVPRLTEWTDSSRVARATFFDIPDPVYWMFYGTVAVMLLVCAWLASMRIRNYLRGGPDDRRTTRENVHRRLRDFRSGVWMRTLLRDPAAGLMHSFIYFGFLVLFAATVVLEIDHQLPPSLKFLHGTVYESYKATANVFGIVFLVGLAWAIGRRYLFRPYRIRIKTKPEDAVILGLFVLIGVTGFLIEGFRIALEHRPHFEEWSFVGWGLSALWAHSSHATLSDLHRTMWIVHA
ncbi:MAG TPA: iron-sulfur protein, partial [Acidimicrobiales bacterium]